MKNKGKLKVRPVPRDRSDLTLTPFIVKDEPVDETELMAVDDATAPEAPLGAGLAVSGAAESASESQEAKAKAKTKGRSRVKTEDQPVLHTEQDRLEWATKEQDIQMLTAELGRMPPDLASTEPEVDKGGDVSSVGSSVAAAYTVPLIIHLTVCTSDCHVHPAGHPGNWC